MSDDLETMVRESLWARADRVDTTAPLVGRARRTVRRRRGLQVGLAAMAVVVAGTAVVTSLAVELDPEIHTLPGDPVGTEGLTPSLWRTEYWHALAVDVPRDWTWGPAPVEDHLCGDKPTAPYVGRPVHLTDVCIGGADHLRETTVPYVWLGADLEPGTVDLGGGFVRETREVAGTTVSVATRDDDLRARILASARRERAHCAPEVAGVARPAAPDLTVCAYQLDDRGRRYELEYAAPLLPRRAAAFERAFERARPFAPGRACDVGRATELVILAIGARRYGISLSPVGCSWVETDGAARWLSIAQVEPWAVDGIPFVVSGPSGGKGAMINDDVG